MLKNFLSLLPNMIMVYMIFVLVTEKHNLKQRLKQKDKRIAFLVNESLKRKDQVITPDIIEAVKFAMIQAHPDNPNGNNELFFRYREVYNKIKE